MAGSATYDFNSQPPADLNFVGNAEWRSSGGASGGANDGYLALFDAVNSQHASVLIPDFDNGLIVKGFSFEVDLRVGNGVGNSGRPADGFSISYARANDPVVNDLKQEPPVDNLNNFAVGGGPENGTATGLAVSFDTWSGNALPDGADIEGIILRLDNKTILRYPMATRNGACDDATSLQTGPYSGDDSGDPSGLCWAKLQVDLDENGKLTVHWKGVDVLTGFDTGFTPSAGRMVFAGRTGGANENTHIDNLKITTIPANKALVTGLIGNPYGVTVIIEDVGRSVLDPATIALQFDGAAVTPTKVSKNGKDTSIEYSIAPLMLAAGSVHPVVINAKDVLGAGISRSANVTIGQYTVLTGDDSLATGSWGDAGFKMRMYQVDHAINNSTAAAEAVLAGKDGDNIADLTSAGSDGFFVVPGVLNIDNGAGNGNFQANNGYQDDAFPGLAAGSTDNAAAEIFTAIQFPAAGLYTLVVNSDDGFKTSAGPNPLDMFNTRGEFSGGRGASDSPYNILVTSPGTYGFRTIWENGTGGANIEWFSVAADGTKALINDSTSASSLKAFQWKPGASAPAYVSGVSPAPGFSGIGRPQSVWVTIVDAGTQVNASSAKLTLNGTEVSVTSTKTAGVTTVKHVNNPDLAPSTKYDASLTYADTNGKSRTVSWSFHTGVLASNPFDIEAEDFDYDSGHANPQKGTAGLDVDVMPYYGGAYDGLSAVAGVDYASTDGADSDLYRQGEEPNKSMDVNNTAGTLDTDRGSWEVTTNYKLGWADSGDWGNYTRNLPSGIYKVYAGLSYDGTGAHDIRAHLYKVTAGVGTPDQTLLHLGQFDGPGTNPLGGWGANRLLPMVDAPGGNEVKVKLSGKTTLRFNMESGDFDFFILSPEPFTPAIVSKITPADGSVSKRNDKIVARIDNLSSDVVASTVSVTFDGADVSSKVVKTPDADGLTISYDPGLMARGSSHTVMVMANDNASPATQLHRTATFTVGFLGTPGTFDIEAEDFNYDGGKANPKAGTSGKDVNVMPYLGGAYDGLSAVSGVDYASTDGIDSDVYRLGESPNKNINENLGGTLGADRGTFSVTTNYKLGWTDTGDWGNYTRTVPAGDYEVYAALSHGDGPSNAHALQGTLGLVDNAAATTQTVTPLGVFDAPGTGGWGSNALVPLVASAGGSPLVVPLSGNTTFRFNMGSGDFDYFLLVPAEAAAKAKFTGITADGANVTFEWTGGGTLQSSTDLVNWTDVPGATSPRTVNTATAPIKFYRVKN